MKSKTFLSGKARLALALALAAVLPLLLASSALLPEEEELPASPAVRSVKAESYTMTSVVREDIVKSVKVSCTYKPARSESLSFTLGGELIENVFVREGDSVTKGQLLAELEKGSLEKQIDSENDALELIRLQISQLNERRALQSRRHTLRLKQIEETPDLLRTEADRLKKEENTSFGKTQEDYQAELAVLQDNETVHQKKLEEYRRNLDRCRLRAGIGGTVSFLREVEEGSRSVEGERFLTISDMSTSVFLVKGDDTRYFTPGQSVTINAYQKEYAATAADSSSFGPEGLDPVLDKDGNVLPVMYFRLEQPDPDLEEEDTASITVLLDSRKNVLCLPSDAVKSANGETVVYYLNEAGIKDMKPVKTGLEADGKIEILSGLEAGESVILK